ncbi:hypothetical protein L596_001221 [Steinernema carpocapsae]|uniref:Uncharacterized protein n=1 Tax=Steinernema carpocapsae TaxID=34508 RepID=A0A4U8UN44_STECR|nr:hypothetical protein L596_001221 [Steinernema carpocapsae]
MQRSCPSYNIAGKVATHNHQLTGPHDVVKSVRRHCRCRHAYNNSINTELTDDPAESGSMNILIINRASAANELRSKKKPGIRRR